MNGISNCLIHFSGGTYDATLSFSDNSTRSLAFNLSAQLAHNRAATQPAWAKKSSGGAGASEYQRRMKMGHVLLHSAAHATRGVMHSDFNANDLKMAAQRRLRFTQHEIDAVHVQLTAWGLASPNHDAIYK